MSAQAFGVALNPQNVVPIDINISTSIYNTIVPPYQNISSGSYQLWINNLSDTYFQTRDRGPIITSNFSYSTVALSLLGSSNTFNFMYQNMRDYNYFPLVTRTSPFVGSMNAVAWNGSVFVGVGSGSNNIATSTDGISWVPRDNVNVGGGMFGGGGAFGVTWNFTMSNWVVVGSNNGAQLSNIAAISRDNGVTWTGVVTNPLGGGSGNATQRPVYAPSLQLFLVANSGSSVLAVSSNPIGPYGTRSYSVNTLAYPVWNGAMFLNADQGNTSLVSYSFNGSNWTTQATIGTTLGFIRSVAWSPTVGIWVASGSNSSGSTYGLVQYSYTPTTGAWSNGVTSSSSGSALNEIIWASTQFVGVGTAAGSFGCYSSTDGITWTLRASSIFTTIANSVAWSPTLGLYVAVGQDTTNNIATSTNLTSWTGRTGLTIFSTRGNSVAWSPQLSMFVAVGSGTNSIAYSFNGINWIGLGATPSTFTNSGLYVVWFPEFSLFVATGLGTNSLLTSPDGINWTPRLSTGVDLRAQAIDWSSVQNQYVMVGLGSHSIATSSDGILWSGRTGNTIFSTQGNAVIHVAVLSLWVALGQGTNTIATSPDGINWTGRGATIFTSTGFAIDWNGTTFVAGGSGTNTIATSPDGITWTGRGATAITSQVRGVAWSSALSLWVVTGTGTNAFATSADNGVTWTGRTGTTFFSTQGEAIEWSPQLNMFVAGGSGTNTIVTSPDGIVWAGMSTLNAVMAAVFSVAWNGVYWIAGGQGVNTVAQSFDGINWTGRGSTIQTNVNGVAWNGSLWVAVGGGTTTAATSTDGITWISRGSPLGGTGFTAFWYAYRSVWLAGSTNGVYTSPDGITYTSRRAGNFTFCFAVNTAGLVAAGLNATTIITSTDGVNWTNRAFSSGTSGVLSIAFSPPLNLWVAVGGFSTHSIMTSTDTITWTGRTGATVFSTSGYSVTWNGNYFIATGEGGNNVATSSDGINWRASPQRQAGGSIWCVGIRPPLMVAGGLGTNSICTSEDDGLSWRPRFSAGATTISCVAWNGYIWVAGNASTAQVHTSPDGITWTTRTTPITTGVLTVVWADQLKLWVAGGVGTWAIATSTDGITWTGRNVSGTGGIFTRVWIIEWNGNRFVALGTSGTGSFTSAISVNGILWQGTSGTVSGSTASMSLAWNGNVWVAGSAASTSLWSSPNGVTWTVRANLSAGNTRVIRWNGTLFVAFGDSTAYLLSRDGFTWTAGTGTIPFSGTTRITGAAWNSGYGHWVITGADSGTNVISIVTTRDLITFTPRMQYPSMTSQVWGFAWAQSLGLWVAVGGNSTTIASSPDGTTWTSRSTTAFGTVGLAVAWNGSLFVAGGGTSTQFFTSTDGITWTSRTNGGIAALVQVNGVVWASSLSLWVAVGGNSGSTQGIIASSTNGTTWTARNTAIFTTTAWGVAWNGSLFVAVGQGTNVFATSTDGITWSARGATGITTAARGIVWATAPGVTSQWVAVGNGTNSIATSTDGVTWVGRTTTTIFSTQGNRVANNGFATVATGTGTNSYAWSYDNGTTWTGGGITAFGTQGLGIAWNSNTGQWLGGASNAPFFLSSSDGINWIGRQNFTTSATCVAIENRPEKTFTINNTHWTGRTSQQTFRILS